MAVAGGMTWYDVLDVLPTARHQDVRRRYEAKCRQLDPGQIAGAPSSVIAAADRARAALEAAWRVLGDPIERERYDEQVGIRRPGSGLERPVAVPSEPRAEDPDGYPAGHAGMRAAAVVGMFTALADRLAPHPRPPRRVAVPDVRGLFMGPCLHAVARAGLRIETVRLTEHPLPVEGLAVDQSPAPGTTVRRLSTLTVRVWHPPVPMSPRPA
ncbi:MAG TPA: PASTA domain-containing protein [Streptosporangiaceae bacterium]|nr:PASTA domain-containing protein [Streptosporangiaceae bacterium]